MSNCTTVFHNIPKVHKIIKELVYGNVADGRRLAELINSDKFKEYCLNDKVAKNSNLEEINANVLKRLIREYRNLNIFSVNNTTNVSANSGIYNMKSQAAYNIAITYGADVIKALNKKIKKEELKGNDFYSVIIKKAKIAFKNALVGRANSYGNKFTIKTPLDEIIIWMNNNEVSEQDSNYCDFVQSVYGADNNIWTEIFANNKLSDINEDFNVEDEKLKEALTNDTDEDVITDTLDTDEIDESTKQWEFGNNVKSYTELVSKDIKDYFDTLVKLNSTETKDVEVKGIKKKVYDQNKNNPLGVVTTHTYQECIIELADVFNNYDGWINLDKFIEAIRERANNKQYFASFIKLADDMLNDKNFANAVYRDINKYIVDCIEVTITPEGNVESIQSNTSNNPMRKMFFNLRNDFKSTAIQLNNEETKSQLNDIKDKIDSYKKSLSLEESTNKIQSARRSTQNIKESNIAKLDEIIRNTKELYRYYFPSLNDLAIDNFIDKNSKNKIENIEKLIAQIENVINSAIKSSNEKQRRDFEIDKIRKENYNRLRIADEMQQDKSTVKLLVEPEFSDSWIIGIDSPIGEISNMLNKYSDSKAELNSRTVDGNLSSDMLYNNYIFNICKVLSNPETLNLWVQERLRNKDEAPSTEYTFSNIIFEDEKLGIKGLVRKKENGDYELTEYGTTIVSSYLINGVTNQMTGTNAKYTNMSDGDYYLLGLYAFLKPTKTYKRYNVKADNVAVTAPYIMRTPSDAPKNFMITMPKYNIDGFWDYDNKALDRYVKNNIDKYNKFIGIDQNIIDRLSKNEYKAIKITNKELAEYIVNPPKKLKINGNNEITTESTNRICFETIDKNGIGYVWFDCKFEYEGFNRIATDLKFAGKQSNASGGYTNITSELNNKLTQEYIDKNKKNKKINTNHPLFNLYYNIIRKELLEYLQAEKDIKRLPKSKLIEWYHYNPKKKGIIGGNVFNFTLLDNNYGVDKNGNSIDKRIKNLLALPSTGGQTISLSNDINNPLNIPEDIDNELKNIINDWLVDYVNNEVYDIKELYGQFIDKIADYELEEYALNQYATNIMFDDLFEGNQKYYKDSQTFLKRTKEVQAGGTSYPGVDYLNPATYNQSVTETGDIITVGGKNVKIRTGWNAITIHNTAKPSSNRNKLYEKLKEVTNEEKAKEIASRFGYVEEGVGENEATTTKTNDAQSYVTIYELARRLKHMGLYEKYKKLLNQLTDETTTIDEININELEEFIQVQKNFYYDHYYDKDLKRHVSRQIKNAEFILVPKFLGEDTSLGKLAKIMIENDIDQVNTQETSKAVNYDVIDFWDNNGNMVEDVDKFIKAAVETKKPFSYMYLYRQQEIPQHMIDAKNKAGIQVMKKILDNGVKETERYRNNFIKAYVQNIKEDFESLMKTFGIKFDEDYNIINVNGGPLDFNKIYKAALREASRLGLDSNMIDYFTIRNNNTPTMPNYMNIVANKIESIAQSQFNKFITRQKLPGWHAAQVTSVGLEGLIKQHKKLKKGETVETDEGKRIELAYHKEDNIAEVLLPKWAKSMFNQYDENGNLIKEIKIEDVDEDVLKCIGYRIPTEGKQSMAVMKVVGFLPDWMGSTIVVPDEWVTQTGSDFDVDSVYGISYETYLGSDDKVHKIEFDDNTDEKSIRRRYNNYIKNNGIKINNINNKEEYNKLVESTVIEKGLMSYNEFSSQSIEAQNSRKARNNKIIDSMIAIMNHKSSIAENLSCSNFDDISAANKKIDKLFGVDKIQYNVNNPLTQIRFRRNAMSGATLKAFSVSRDTGNSVFNVSKGRLNTPIRVKYHSGIKENLITEAFNINKGWVEHYGLGNSKNDKNVEGEYITIASSHTTAHILDAIKEGAIPNENEFTFAAFKTLFDIGMDAYSAILWIRQPGISRIVDAYYESQSVFVTGQFNPIHVAIKRIARDLGITINKELVNDYSSINEVLAALNKQYGEKFKNIYPNSSIAFNNSEEAEVNNINIPNIENRIKNDNLIEEDELLLFDLGAIINFNYIDGISKIISNHIRVLNPDKFGAKQTIFETNKILDNIKELYESGQAYKIVDEKGNAIINAIYPKLILVDDDSRGNYFYNIYLEYYLANKELGAYPSLNAFMKYSTVPSIIINRNLFDTERKNFVNSINYIESFISGRVDKKLYTDFKKYILDSLYKQSCNILTNPIKLNKNNQIEIDIDESINNLKSKDSSPVKVWNNEELARIYGYGYSIDYDINIDNINKPTAEEIKAFNKLTPGQKVHFIQSRLLDSERSIFNYIKVNLYDERQIRKTGASMHNITFDDQQQDMETIYSLFQTAFDNNNPLIRLTMIDIIKYAFVVEGYQFRKGNISKIIKNDALYKSIEDRGTGIIDSIKNVVNSINNEVLLANNTYEDYIRSHSNIKQIPTYRIRYKNKKPNIYPVADGKGMYMLSTADKSLETLKDMKLIREGLSEDNKSLYYLNSRYINITNNNKITLYKVKEYEVENNKVIYLVPMNKLEPNEHGEFSVNNKNNKYPNYAYYERLIEESRNNNIPFSRLKEANNELYNKEVIESYKAKNVKQQNETVVPTNNTYLINVKDGATKQMINKINKAFANPNTNNVWIHNGSFEVKNAFKNTNIFSEQIIYDENGTPQKYLIKRVKFKNLNNKTISENEALEAIKDAKDKGLKSLDGIYYVQKYKETKAEEVTVDPSDIHLSSIDTNIEQQSDISDFNTLSHQFVVDIKGRAKVFSDKEAVRVLNDFMEYNIDVDLISDINLRTLDIIKRSTTYYASKAIELRDKIDNFYIDELGESHDILDEKTIELIKKDENIRKQYIELILSASTFGNNFPLIKQIATNNIDDFTKRNINTIKDTINNIANDDKIKKAFNIVAIQIFQAESSNPIFDSNLGDIVSYITKDASWLDSMIQDTQELSIPIIQVVLKHVNDLVHQRNFEGKETTNEIKRKLNKIKEDAKKAGKEINMNHIVDENGKFVSTVDEKFYTDYVDKIKALNEAKEKGINSKEYIKAKFELDKWLTKNTNQKYINQYYTDIINNQELLMGDNIIDYYIEYRKLIDRRNDILRKFKNNRTDADKKELKDIRAKIASMRDTYDYNTGELKFGVAYQRAKLLDEFIIEKENIQKRYFTRIARPGFENELQHYIDIIDKYRKFDSRGHLITNEELLMQNDEYVNAVEWLNENTIFDIDKDIKNKIRDSFFIIGGKKSNKQFKSIISTIKDVYDSNGIINGLLFNDKQIEAIKNEQETKYKNDVKRAESRLIRNRSNDERIYSKKFYDNFGESVSNPNKEKLIKDINKIMIKALDNDGKVLLSKLNIDEIRTLSKLYDQLDNFKSTKSDKVKAFLANEVEFPVDKPQWIIDESNAKQKGTEYYNAWKTIANEKDFVDGLFIGYKNTPNSKIFGYIRPKTDKNGNVINEDYIDKKREEAIKYIKEHIKFIPTKYYWEARKQVQLKGEEEYAKWEEANHIFNPITGELEPIRIWITVEYTGYGNNAKFYQANYDNTVSKPLPGVENNNYNGVNTYNNSGNYDKKDPANEYEKQYRELMQQTMLTLTKDNPAANKFIMSGKFPRKAKSKGGFEGTIKAVGNFVGFAANVDNDRTLSDNIGYEYYRNANIPMLEMLKDNTYKKPIKIREKGITETDEEYNNYVKEIKKQNEEITEYNKQLDVKLIDRNYEAIFEEFINRAIDANAKAECKIELYYLLEFLRKYYKGYKVTGFGNLAQDKKFSTKDKKAYKEIEVEHAIKMVEVWSKRLLFDEYKSKSKYSKTVSILQNIASSKYMMFNITGGIGNILTGSVNIFMERFAGEYFDLKDWEKAKFNYYLKSVPNFVLNMNKDTSTDLTDAIIKLMGIVDYAGVNGIDKNLSEANAAEFIDKLKNYAYAPQSASEHFMQNTAMITMMLSNRIYTINGKTKIGDFHNYTRDIENLAMRKVLEENKDYLDLYNKFINNIKEDKNKLKDYHWFKHDINTDFLRSLNNKELAYKYDELRKEMLKNAKERFEKEIKVIDQFELVNGYAQIKKDSPLNFKLLAGFKGKVVSVNKKIHGVYDKLGGASIESTQFWGGIAMQYHKHIYTGALKRWRINGYYNESRETTEKGFYVSMWNFATTEFSDIKERIKNNDENAKFIVAIQEICRSVINTFLNYKFNYATMSLTERANLRRALGELMGITYGLIGGIAASCLLLGADDDDETLQFIGNLALYQADRLSSETIMYNIGAVSEFDKLWSSPIAIGSSFKDIFGTLGFVAEYIINSDEFNPDYTTGQYRGENKLEVIIGRQIPIYRAIQRLNRLDQNNKYYKLTENMLSIIPTKDIAEFIMNE